MAASVRLEDETFSCMRYERLAELAGLADSDHARGKMAKLWRQCTLEQRHILPESDIVRVLGPDGVRALVCADLGEVVAEGVRMRGTRGRIEWLKKLRANGKKGGRPRKPKGKPSGFAANNLPAPAPAPAPVLQDLTLPPAKPEAIDPVDDFKLAEGTKPGARPKTLPPPPDPDAYLLADLLRETILSSKPDHRLNDAKVWHPARRAWAKTMAKLLRRRARPKLEAAIRYVGAQAGGQYALVIESAAALDEKLDRVELAMARAEGSRPGSAPENYVNRPLRVAASSVGQPWPGTLPGVKP
jgi:hypothetical protein